MITIIVNRVEEHSQLPYLQKLANAFEVFENFRGKLSPRVSKYEHFLNETVQDAFLVPSFSRKVPPKTKYQGKIFKGLHHEGRCTPSDGVP